MKVPAGNISIIVQTYSYCFLIRKHTSVHLKAGDKIMFEISGKITRMLKCIADELCVYSLSKKILNLWMIVDFFIICCESWKIYSNMLVKQRIEGSDLIILKVYSALIEWLFTHHQKRCL